MIVQKIQTLFILLFLSLNSIAQTDTDQQEIYTMADTSPEFSGGQTALLTYLSSNINYPPFAIENGVEGRVYISFVVNQDGSVSNTKVLRGIGSGCDEEAVRVVNAMPKWKPGKVNNKTVRVQYTIPIAFKLDRVDTNHIYTYEAVSEKPAFVGDNAELEKYVSQNLKYPGIAQKTKVAGDVKVTFIIEKDGSLSNVKIIKGIGSGCDEEALRLIKNMPKWNPAKEKGEVVRCMHYTTITFSLNQKRKQVKTF